MQPYQVDRVTELIQRTNQLNTSIKRYTKDQIIFYSQNKNCDIFTASVSDKFGDYGLVGVCIGFHKNNIYGIDTLLFSCRVMSKGVEDYMLTSVLNYAGANNFERVILHFSKGSKNDQMRTILSNNNFIESVIDDEHLVYVFDLKQQQIKPLPKWFSSPQPGTTKEPVVSV
jgi:FkbH-like protein